MKMYERKTTDVYDIMVKEGRGKPRHVYQTHSNVEAAKAEKRKITESHPEWNVYIVKKRIKTDQSN